MRNSTVKIHSHLLKKIEKLLQVQLVVWNVTDLSINSNYDKDSFGFNTWQIHYTIGLFVYNSFFLFCFVFISPNTNIITFIIMFIWMHVQLATALVWPRADYKHCKVMYILKTNVFVLKLILLLNCSWH